MRSGRPCVLGEKDPPSTVLRYAYEHGVYCVRAFSDYLIETVHDHWNWHEPGFCLNLPYPRLRAPVQIQNAACAIAALRASNLNISDTAWAEGVTQAHVTGRLQQWRKTPEVMLDVAHNRQSVAQLALWLAQNPRPTAAVFCALKDKDVSTMIEQLKSFIQHWYIGVLSNPIDRTFSMSELRAIFRQNLPEHQYSLYATVPLAYQEALTATADNNRIVVFGSFHTLEALMQVPQ
jgi:dihydrofolate synthase/folylpolyglutamate synthase